MGYRAGCILAILQRCARPTPWVWDVFSSSQMGVVSAFSFGEGKGILKGVIRALDIDLQYVSPSVWKNNLGCSANKQTSRDRAKELFPFQIKLLRSEAKCEASLIGLFGLLSTSIRV